MEPERSITRPTSRGRCTAWAVAETFGRNCEPKMVLKAPGKLTLAENYLSVEPYALALAHGDEGFRLAVDRALSHIYRGGEIYLRGPNLMRGICGRTRTETFTPDGYYPTGDAGLLDADGYLYFAGRLDDMFKVHGANVYPSEVEAALEAIAYVRRAFVVDIGGDDGRRVGAAVVLAPNDSHATADLDADARRALSSFKVPARWAIIEADDVPRAATGKVDKDGLRRLIESAS